MDHTRHTVTIETFYIGKYPVTFAEYDVFARSTGRERPNDKGWGRNRRLVINVSWEDAVAYSEWLSEQTDKNYVLPREAEWEYAARAGTVTLWCRGNYAKTAGDYAWFDENSDSSTHTVGGKRSNDMVGNVWEWVQDCWHSNYHNAPSNGRAWLNMFKRSADRNKREQDLSLIR